MYRNVSGQITIETIDDNTSKDTLELKGVCGASGKLVSGSERLARTLGAGLPPGLYGGSSARIQTSTVGVRRPSAFHAST